MTTDFTWRKISHAHKFVLARSLSGVLWCTLSTMLKLSCFLRSARSYT